MSLDKRQARSLTSREISKIIGGVLGGLATWCHPDEIMEAMNHFSIFSERYRKEWVTIHGLTLDSQVRIISDLTEPYTDPFNPPPSEDKEPKKLQFDSLIPTNPPQTGEKED